MKITNSRGGFGLAEMMVAMLATSIMALMVGSMLVYGWGGWKRNNDSVAMQRDASLAMRVLAKEIRRTPIGGVTIAANTLTCTSTNGTHVFYESNGSLMLEANSAAAWPLVRNAVVSFGAQTNVANSVRITLNLNTGSDVSTNSMIIFSRN